MKERLKIISKKIEPFVDCLGSVVYHYLILLVGCAVAFYALGVDMESIEFIKTDEFLLISSICFGVPSYFIDRQKNMRMNEKLIENMK